MMLALVFALALMGAEPPATTSADALSPPSAAPEAANAAAPVARRAMTREEEEDVIPEGAPKPDYEFVAWCHGALAGQMELDPLVEKDMDAIEGKAKAAKRHANDEEIAKEHKRYLALYEKALVAAEKASPTAIHQNGVDAEIQGYKIWGPTRNKEPVWRMVDWGNWEVPPRCEKAAKRLYDNASLLGVALKAETPPEPPAAVSTPSAPDAPDAGKATPPSSAAETKPQADGLRGPN